MRALMFILCLIVGLALPVSGVSANDGERAEAVKQALKRLWEIGEVQPETLHYLMVREKYNELDKLYDDLLNDFLSDRNYENRFAESFDYYGKDAGMSLGEIQKWVKATGSPYSYIARGWYYQNEGYAARGSSYSSETSDAEFAEMQKYHEMAFSDFMYALEQNNRLLPAYKGLMNITTASRLPLTLKQVLDMSIEADPANFATRHTYQVSVEPKWGGSIEEMRQVAKDAEAYVDENPYLWSLHGQVHSYLGNLSYWDGEYEDAIQHYTDAMQFGLRTSWLKSRGKAYYYAGKRVAARMDFEHALEYNPDDSSFRQWIVWSSRKN